MSSDHSISPTDKVPLLDPNQIQPRPSKSSRPRRRLTFSGPSLPVPASSTNYTATVPDSSLHQISPRVNANPFDTDNESLNDNYYEHMVTSPEMDTSESASVLRDLRSYDPHNLPSTRPNYAKSHSGTKPPPHRNSRQRSSSSAEFHPFANALQSSSPSYAERWVNTAHRYGSTASGNPIRVDMDKLKASSTSNEADNVITSTHTDSEVDFDSKPSTRRNSETSSLDDVCFPLDQLDNNEGAKPWPDLQVLDEFYEEETTRLKDEVLQETTEANFRFDGHDNDDGLSLSNSPTGVGFSRPIVTKVDLPPTTLLGNQKINETETINGRLRPPKINPFDKRRINNSEFLKTINYPPQIVSNNPEHFKFTYFREDLDSTVHSPTISGLLQPGQRFSDLFLHSEYAKNGPEYHGGSSLHSTRQGTHANNSTANSYKGSTTELKPLEELAPSVVSDVEDHVSPFWLDILNPTEEEMKVISKAFAIHPLTTEDIFLGETREKVELFKDYYFVCFRSFDIVHEKARRREKNKEKKSELSFAEGSSRAASGLVSKLFGPRRRHSSSRSVHSVAFNDNLSQSSSFKRRAKEIELEKFQRKSGDRHKPRNNELEPLNVYILVFRHAVITFHFAPTPHPVNVRRRARLLREYLTVSADWIAYALIDDITDAFGPMIESIEDEVNDIEDAILRMNDDSDSDSSDDEDEFGPWNPRNNSGGAIGSAASVIDDKRSVLSVSSSSSRSTASNVIEWKKKGDMLKRIGESRKRVMSLLRLLGSKADVIKGFAKRCNEQWEVAPRSEIGMYLGDIQDHIVTMVQSLNHYEKLLARSHSNYLAQINIDMTKVNNDMNDVLGKITILGTVVLPMNIITGLWGMNVLVPGQEADGLKWFYSITFGMFLFAFFCYTYAKRLSGIA